MFALFSSNLFRKEAGRGPFVAHKICFGHTWYKDYFSGCLAGRCECQTLLVVESDKYAPAQALLAEG